MKIFKKDPEGFGAEMATVASLLGGKWRHETLCVPCPALGGLFRLEALQDGTRDLRFAAFHFDDLPNVPLTLHLPAPKTMSPGGKKVIRDKSAVPDYMIRAGAGESPAGFARRIHAEFIPHLAETYAEDLKKRRASYLKIKDREGYTKSLLGAAGFVYEDDHAGARTAKIPDTGISATSDFDYGHVEVSVRLSVEKLELLMPVLADMMDISQRSAP